MTVEIKPTGEVFEDTDHKKWLPVNISFGAISQINKIILGDIVDKDDRKKVAMREQVHKDCLELFDLFNNVGVS